MPATIRADDEQWSSTCPGQLRCRGQPRSAQAGARPAGPGRDPAGEEDLYQQALGSPGPLHAPGQTLPGPKTMAAARRAGCPNGDLRPPGQWPRRALGWPVAGLAAVGAPGSRPTGALAYGGGRAGRAVVG